MNKKYSSNKSLKFQRRNVDNLSKDKSAANCMNRYTWNLKIALTKTTQDTSQMTSLYKETLKLKTSAAQFLAVL